MTTSSGYVWLTDLSRQFLGRDYLNEGQTAEQRFEQIAYHAEEILGLPGYAERFLKYLKAGYYSLSTPIMTNFGNPHREGLPISCFGSYIGDSMEEILDAHAEIGTMTKHGGGTSAYFGDLRPRGAKIRGNGESSGSVHFMEMFESVIKVVSQGSTRRGNFAAYLNVDHKDIHEFLTLRSEGSPIQDLSFGVVIPPGWMDYMLHGADKAIRRKMREVWVKIIDARLQTGYPYMMFGDNVLNGAPEIYKALNIHQTNLCTEIFLPNNASESFVCDLSSMNMYHADEWMKTDAVEVLVFLLDAVMTEFIQKASKLKHMERAVRFAERHRALGVGWLGWHSYLQRKMIPFESMEAKWANIEIARKLKEQVYEASAALAQIYGEPEMLKGTGRRNTTLLAIAPTKSSAFIFGQVSEGIEPHRSNYFIKDLAKGKYAIRNPELKKLLAAKGKDTEEVWLSILEKAGSVQHLDFLTDHEKMVFKTFEEISQKEIIIQAGARQRHIDQGQSINLIIPPGTSAKDISDLYVLAWRLGVKSLYYQINKNAAQELARSLNDCVSCSA